MSSTLTSHVVRHDGFSTHHLATESTRPRPTLLLVHDGWFGADARTLWSPLMPLLADEFRLLAPDMLGFGASDKLHYYDRTMYAYRAAHLGSFLRAVCTEEEPVHAIGTSMGGSILLRDVVSVDPQLPVRSVVSISGAGGPWRSTFGAQQLGQYEGTIDDIARVMDHMAGDFDGRDGVIADRHANTEIRGHVQCLLAGGVKRPGAMGTPPADPWPIPLRNLVVPVTVVAGEHDPLLEPGWQHQLDGVSPLLKTQQIDARHAPSLDRPALVAGIIRDHVLRTGEPVSASAAGRL